MGGATHGAMAADAPAAPPNPPSPAPATRLVEAWVVLAMPGAISAAARNATEREDHRIRIESEQARVMRELTALGASTRGRQTLTRSALLVEVDESLLDRIARIPGVLRVQTVTHGHSTDERPPVKRDGPDPSPATRR